MSYLVVLPVIDRELSEECYRRLDVPADKLLVVDNSAEGFAAGWDAQVVRPRVNLGVARSWNLGYRHVVDYGLDYLVLLSAATHFAPGGFAALASAMEHGLDARGIQTQEGWHCAALGRPLLEACGPFDENFWPAYFEDLDYLWRMECSGLWHASENPLPQLTVDASRWGDAHGMIRCGVQVHFTALLGYYEQKWGAHPHVEKWRLPFGDRPLGYWNPVDVETLSTRYGVPVTHLRQPVG